MKRIKLFLTAVSILLCGQFAWAQTQVTGTVTDSAGEALQGVAVFQEGTTKGALTGPDGKYSVNVPGDATLTFSMLGYATVTEAVAGRKVINVTLQDDSTVLDETIVVAFGTSTKEAFTGSAKVVGSEKIEKAQVSNATRALEGTVAGVQMTTSSGTLGSNPTIMIRGFSSISADSTPLYVVDGIPFPGDMNNLNPADIESITVLKDAASNALYGSRGATGVIQITTKKAKTSNAVINVDAKVGVNSKALRTYDYIKDPAQYYETYYGALYNYYRLEQKLDASAAHLLAAQTTAGPIGNGGLGYQIYTVPEGQLFIGSNGKLNPNATLGRVVNYKGQDYYLTGDDWMKAAYRNSIRQEYNINASGNTGKASFYASFGYLNNQGIIEAASMERYTARLKANYQAKKWLRLGGNMGFAHYRYDNGNSDEGDGSVGNVFSFAASMAPIFPVYIRDGQGNIMKDQYGNKRYDFGDGANAGMYRSISSNSNALQLLTLDINNTEGNSFDANGFVEVSFLKDFKFTFNAGYGIDEYRSTSMNNMYYGQFSVNGGILAKEHDRTTYLNLQQLLTWSHTFKDKYHVDILLGHENYVSKSYSLYADKSKMFSIKNLELGGAVIDGQSAASSFGEYNNEGYFTRAQFDWDNTVFLSASFRRDASSRFHPKHRWGNFWSLGAAWIINKHPWFNASWVDMLKLKTSIGSQGNDRIGSYRYTDLYNVSNNEGEIAIAFSSKGNEKISWETNTNFNIGVEAELFGGRLNADIEYFYRKTSDMLFWFTVPASLGYSGYYDNIGDMRNSGLEFDLEGVLFVNKNIRWSVNLNGTHYTNKIIRLPEERKIREVEGYSGYASGNKFIGEGLPLNTFFMRRWKGVDKATGLNQWQKDVLDKDGNVIGKTVTTKYSDATQYLCSDTTPKIYGGFGTDFEAYGFDLSLQFTYSYGGLTYDGGYASLVASPSGNVGGNIHKDCLKAWTPENNDSNIPRFVYNDEYTSSASTRFLTDATYWNFQRAQIGYTFPSKWTEKIKISRLRLYVTADNICYWSRRPGLDPRQSFTGATNDSMNSPVRTVSGGINITF